MLIFNNNLTLNFVCDYRLDGIIPKMTPKLFIKTATKHVPVIAKMSGNILIIRMINGKWIIGSMFIVV